ncbi:MAG: DUF805 domain-containing protein [Alphaproteobacteria bacterium]|nr:DUF805 domain-containing protein [Alphaproteobacteria bacterium]
MEMLKILLKNYVNVMKKFYDYKGRAGRLEFWGFFLINWFVIRALIALSVWQDAFSYLLPIYGIMLIVTFAALLARRLHDTGRSAFWLLGILLSFVMASSYVRPLPVIISSILSLIAVISVFYIVILCFCPSAKENKYGPTIAETKRDKITIYACMGLYLILLSYTFWGTYNTFKNLEANSDRAIVPLVVETHTPPDNK